MSATARATATRPASRPSTPRSAPARTRRPALQEVRAPGPVRGRQRHVRARSSRGCSCAGMLGLLVLNTTLAQGAFEIGSLTQVKRDLAVNEQRLLQTVAHAEAPESLQQRADALGMVPAQAPVFLRLADRTVLGRPTPAKAQPRKASGAASAAKTPATTSDAATPTRSQRGQAEAVLGSRRSRGLDDRRGPPRRPTGPGMSDEARPDAPTGESQP